MSQNPYSALIQAEAIARQARRMQIDQLVDECEKSEDRTLRSLARLYRRITGQ